MSMMVSFVLSFFPRDVLDEILNLIESVSEDFLTTLPYPGKQTESHRSCFPFLKWKKRADFPI